MDVDVLNLISLLRLSDDCDHALQRDFGQHPSSGMYKMEPLAKAEKR